MKQDQKSPNENRTKCAIILAKRDVSLRGPKWYRNFVLTGLNPRSNKQFPVVKGIICKYGFDSSGKGAILPLNKQTKKQNVKGIISLGQHIF